MHGNYFIIVTYQKSLKFIQEQRFLIEEKFKLASKSTGFDFEIKYRPGRELSKRIQFSTVFHNYLTSISYIIQQNGKKIKQPTFWNGSINNGI